MHVLELKLVYVRVTGHSMMKSSPLVMRIFTTSEMVAFGSGNWDQIIGLAHWLIGSFHCYYRIISTAASSTELGS